MKQCGPLDARPLTLWADSNLKKDYFFRTGHWQKILRDTCHQVYAICWCDQVSSINHEIIGVAILTNGTNLVNLFIDPAWRSRGVGTHVMELLQPEIVRCKTDVSSGDPTPFYKKLGFHIVQEAQGKKGNITVLAHEQAIGRFQ